MNPEDKPTQTKIRSLGRIVLGTGLLAGTLSATANPFFHNPAYPGFIVLAEQRFDPAVQRYMAEQSLRAMPLKDGQLYYVYPMDTSNAYIEQMQIRYLEVLLNQRPEENSHADEPDRR